MRTLLWLVAAIALVALYAAPVQAQTRTDPAPAIQINKAAYDAYMVSLGVDPAAAAAHNLTDTEVSQLRAALTGAIDAANLGIALASSLPPPVSRYVGGRVYTNDPAGRINQAAQALLETARQQRFGDLESSRVRLDDAVMAARSQLAITAPQLFASYLQRQTQQRNVLSELSSAAHDTARSLIQNIR